MNGFSTTNYTFFFRIHDKDMDCRSLLLHWTCVNEHIIVSAFSLLAFSCWLWLIVQLLHMVTCSCLCSVGISVTGVREALQRCSCSVILSLLVSAPVHSQGRLFRRLWNVFLNPVTPASSSQTCLLWWFYHAPSLSASSHFLLSTHELSQWAFWCLIWDASLFYWSSNLKSGLTLVRITSVFFFYFFFVFVLSAQCEELCVKAYRAVFRSEVWAVDIVSIVSGSVCWFISGILIRLLFHFSVIITRAGRLALFTKTATSPLSALSWLTNVPFTAHAFLLHLEDEVIIQHRTWTNTHLLHSLKNPCIAELEQRVCSLKCPLTLCRDEEHIPTEPSLTELLIWQSVGFPKWWAQIFAQIVEFTPASTLDSVWFHTANFQASPLLRRSSLLEHKW